MKTTNQRLDILERATTVLTYSQNVHAEAIADYKKWLAVLSKGQVELKKQYELTQKQLRESDTRSKQRNANLDARSKQRNADLEARSKQRNADLDARSKKRSADLDKRISDLVSAIGELIRRKN